MIIIPTNSDRVDTWLKDCLESLETRRKVIILSRDKPIKRHKNGFSYVCSPKYTFTSGALFYAKENLDVDEFFILHDSCIVKDNRLWDVVFDGYAGNSVSLSSHPSPIGMFLGKYRMEVVKKLPTKIATTKEEDVTLEEEYNQAYARLDYPVTIDNPLNISDKFVTRHGRENMMLENKWMIKYKGTWTRGMI